MNIAKFGLQLFVILMNIVFFVLKIIFISGTSSSRKKGDNRNEDNEYEATNGYDSSNEYRPDL